MSAPESTGGFHVRYVLAVIGLVVAATWIRQAFSSLWLDELGTVWVIKDGAGAVVSRAFEYHGQSPAYYLVAWLVAKAAGRSEFVLRLPSMVAIALSTWFLWRLVTRLVSRDAALMSVLGFLCLVSVSAAATDARPYAIALLFLIAAADAFVRWLDRGRFIDALVFVVLAVATVWTHYVIALPLVPLAAYGLVRRRDSGVSLASQAIAWSVAAVCLVPLVSQLASLYGRRATLSPPYDGSVGDLLGVIAPTVLVAGLGLGALLARAMEPIAVRNDGGRRGSLFLLSTWLLFPPVVLVGTSLVADLNLFAGRYFLSVTPAAAALFGWGVSRIDPQSARRTIAITSAALAVLVGGGALVHGEDWRAAAQAERSVADDGTLLFLHPALVESAQLDWFEDPERADYLLSPSDYYALEGTIVPLPYMLEDPGAQDYLARVTRDEVGGVDRFLLLTRYPFVPYRPWWEGRLGPDGWGSRSLGMFGDLELIEFTKDGAEPPPS